MRILVLQLKRIGDAILTAPAMGALRQALPDAEITLVLAGAAASMGRAFAMADQTLTYGAGKPARQCWRNSLLGRYDAVLDFSGTDRSAALTAISRAKFRVAYAKDAKNWLRKRAYNVLSDASVRNLHTIDLHHALVTRLLEEMQISPAPNRERLRPSDPSAGSGSACLTESLRCRPSWHRPHGEILAGCALGGSNPLSTRDASFTRDLNW